MVEGTHLIFKSQEDRLISSVLYAGYRSSILGSTSDWASSPQLKLHENRRKLDRRLRFLEFYCYNTPTFFLSMFSRGFQQLSLLTIVYGLVVDDGSQEDSDSGGQYARSWVSRVREVCKSQTWQRRTPLTNHIPNRLHFQHWTWQYRLGYLLHPSIERRSHMRVIEVETGNA